MFALKNARFSLFKTAASSSRTATRSYAALSSQFSSNLLGEMDVGVRRSEKAPLTDRSQPPLAPGTRFLNPMRMTERSVSRDTDTFMPNFFLYVRITRNNTKITFTGPSKKRKNEDSPEQYVLAAWSGGSVGFKGHHRSGYEAGYQCAVRAFKEVYRVAQNEYLPLRLGLNLKGIGQGRDAFLTALRAVEGEQIRPLVASVEDTSPIKIGGTRAKKARRM